MCFAKECLSELLHYFVMVLQNLMSEQRCQAHSRASLGIMSLLLAPFHP